MTKRIVASIALSILMCGGAFAAANCSGLPTEGQLRAALIAAGSSADPASGPIGGLFNGSRMWGALVNRDGEVCAYTTNQSDPTQVWPGSQAIAKAKAYTANAFSLDVLALSTANLYTFTQPGHSLWSLGQSNLFDPKALAAPGGQGGNNQIAGGLIFFGGGLALYKNGKIIGGLGVSGDTSCADHEVAKRVRSTLGLNPPGGATADDIDYAAGLFTHPKCINTWKNAVFVGNETPANPY